MFLSHAQRERTYGLLVGREGDSVGQQLWQFDGDFQRAVDVFGNIVASIPAILASSKKEKRVRPALLALSNHRHQ